MKEYKKTTKDRFIYNNSAQGGGRSPIMAKRIFSILVMALAMIGCHKDEKKQREITVVYTFEALQEVKQDNGTIILEKVEVTSDMCNQVSWAMEGVKINSSNGTSSTVRVPASGGKAPAISDGKCSNTFRNNGNDGQLEGDIEYRHVNGYPQLPNTVARLVNEAGGDADTSFYVQNTSTVQHKTFYMLIPASDGLSQEQVEEAVDNVTNKGRACVNPIDLNGQHISLSSFSQIQLGGEAITSETEMIDDDVCDNGIYVTDLQAYNTYTFAFISSGMSGEGGVYIRPNQMTNTDVVINQNLVEGEFCSRSMSYKFGTNLQSWNMDNQIGRVLDGNCVPASEHPDMDPSDITIEIAAECDGLLEIDSTGPEVNKLQVTQEFFNPDDNAVLPAGEMNPDCKITATDSATSDSKVIPTWVHNYEVVATGVNNE